MGAVVETSISAPGLHNITTERIISGFFIEEVQNFIKYTPGATINIIIK